MKGSVGICVHVNQLAYLYLLTLTETIFLSDVSACGTRDVMKMMPTAFLFGQLPQVHTIDPVLDKTEPGTFYDFFRIVPFFFLLPKRLDRYPTLGTSFIRSSSVFMTRLPSSRPDGRTCLEDLIQLKWPRCYVIVSPVIFLAATPSPSVLDGRTWFCMSFLTLIFSFPFSPNYLLS